MTIKGYVAVNKKTGALMGIDRQSGGYPYDACDANSHPEVISNVCFFKELRNIETYLESFPEYEIKPFTLTWN